MSLSAKKNERISMEKYLKSTEIIDCKKPEILSDPLPIIIETLRKYKTKDELLNNLPDLSDI